MNVDAEVFGPYRLDELLGRGGMGEVYRAYDLEFERTVAVKRLSAHLADDPRFQERFRREAHHVARLRNPHIVPIHRFGEINGQLYIDMRYVEGGDLADLIRTTGPLPPDRAVRILEHLASALDDAHANGLVHRDVKPSNALLDRRVADFCYLADFGITRLATDRRSNSLTRTGALLGSLAYMAPEQFDGMVTMQSDIYSLTCVFYEMLTGARPYEGDALPVLMHAHIKVAAPRPSERNPAAVVFDEVVATGMAKMATDRFTSAGALAEAARAALAGRAAPSPADDEPTRPERELPTLAGTTVGGTPAAGGDSDAGEKPYAATPAVSRGFHHGESAVPTRRAADGDTVSLRFRHGESGLSARRVGNSDTASPGGGIGGSRSGGRGTASVRWTRQPDPAAAAVAPRRPLTRRPGSAGQVRARRVMADPAGPVRARRLMADPAGPVRARRLMADPAGPVRARRLMADPAGPVWARPMRAAVRAPQRTADRRGLRPVMRWPPAPRPGSAVGGAAAPTPSMGKPTSTPRRRRTCAGRGRGLARAGCRRSRSPR